MSPRLLSVFVLLLLLPPSAIAAVWQVPSETCPTIQDGLNLAMEGDTVAVATGDYYPQETIYWPARNGVVLIGAGADDTRVFGTYAAPILIVSGAVPIDSTTKILDLQFRDSEDYGLVAYGSAPLIRDCMIVSNSPGGLLCYSDAAPSVESCQITGNSGAGVEVQDCPRDPRFLLCRVSDTLAGYETGQGIRARDSSFSVEGCEFSGNSEGAIKCESCDSVAIMYNDLSRHPNYAGVIWCVSSTAVISGNTFTDNPSSYAAIYANEQSDVVIRDNYISETLHYGVVLDVSSGLVTGNSISGCGYSGVFLYGSEDVVLRDNEIYQNNEGVNIQYCSPEIAENLIYRNSRSGVHIGSNGISPWVHGNSFVDNVTPYQGGGISSSATNSLPRVEGNTFVGNRSMGYGPAVFLENSSALFVANTFVDNTSQSDTDLGALFAKNCNPIVSDCNFVGNGWALGSDSWLSVPQASENWWGSDSGPWHEWLNEEGQGDSVVAHCWDLLPWLESPSVDAPPLPPTGLRTMVVSGDSVYSVRWNAVPVSDVAGYIVHYDTDEAGYPYANALDVGDVTATRLEGLLDNVTYYVAVTCYDLSGDGSWYSDGVELTPPASGIANETDPEAIALLGPISPNPSTGGQMLKVVINRRSSPVVTLYDVQGRRLSTLGSDLIRGSGSGDILWEPRMPNGERLVEGVYFLRAQTAEGRMTIRKFVLLD